MEALYKQMHTDGTGDQGISNRLVLLGYKYEGIKQRLE